MPNNTYRNLLAMSLCILFLTTCSSEQSEATTSDVVAEKTGPTVTSSPTETLRPSATIPATDLPTPTVQPSSVPEFNEQRSIDRYNRVTSGFTGLIDEIGAIMVEVPNEWSDVDITPDSIDGESDSPAIRASSDLAAFYQGWHEPGMEFLVSSFFTEIYASPAEYLDDTASAYLAAGCVLAARHDYDDGLYSGQVDEWVLCDGQGEEGAVLILALTSIANPWDYMIALVIQIVADDDWNTVDTILESFTVSDDLTSEVTSGFTVLVDEIGAIMVEVPNEWSDVDITPDSIDGESDSPAIRASSDLAAFYQGWHEPGMEFLVSSFFTEIYASPAEYLDDTASAYLAAGCVLAARHDYDDGLYSGQVDEWVLCDGQGEEGAVLILALTSIANPWDYMIALVIQIVADDDWNTVDTILESFTVSDDLTSEVTTEDDVSIDEPIDQQPVDDFAQAGTWTVLVYLMGDNDLEFFAGLDLEEMLSIDASTGLNLLVLADRSPLDEDYDGGYTGSDFVGLGDWNGTRLLLFGDHDVSVLAEGENLNMGDADTLADFIEFGLSNYPADRNALIFWDHGAGWPGMGPDEFAGENPVDDTLDLSEIQTGISSGLSRVAVERLDLVGFDACLMATYEVAAAITGLADYMLASEELEPGHGWDYSSLAVLSGSRDITAIDLGSAITDGFQSQAQDWDTEESITLSVLDLTVFPEFQLAIGDLLSPLVSDLAPAAPSVSRALNGASRFASSPNPVQDAHIVDLGNFVEGLSGIGIDDEIERVLNVLDRLVVDKVSGIATKRASGVAVYFPPAADYADGDYLDLDVAPAWQSFLESFLLAGEEIPKTSRAKLNQEETTIDYYFDSDGLTVSAQFDSASQENITEVVLYYAVIDPADDELYYIGEDPGWINDDGTVSAFYDLTILTMSDAFDTSYAYTYFSVDEDENLYFFDIPLGYTPSSELENDESIRDVELSLAIDGDTGEILSAVYYEVDESGQWGQFIADPEGAIFPIVQMEDDDGSLVWVSASDLWLYADLEELTYSFEPLPPGITLIADLYVYDYGGHSDYVSIETTVPDSYDTD